MDWVSADEHDRLVEAHCDMLQNSLNPSVITLAERTGFPAATCEAWIRGGRQWPPSAKEPPLR